MVKTAHMRFQMDLTGDYTGHRVAFWERICALPMFLKRSEADLKKKGIASFGKRKLQNTVPFRPRYDHHQLHLARFTVRVGS